MLLSFADQERIVKKNGLRFLRMQHACEGIMAFICQVNFEQLPQLFIALVCTCTSRHLYDNKTQPGYFLFHIWFSILNRVFCDISMPGAV